jgi:LysM repeat protein
MYGKRIVQIVLVFALLVASFANVTGSQAWSSSCPRVYYVQPGDWLAKIARNCGVTLSSLYAANPWTAYSAYIYPGQVIIIPGGYDAGGVYCGPGYDNYGSYYIVCRGDTLGGIAMYYGVTVKYLQWRNNIANANRIYPGQLIRPY